MMMLFELDEHYPIIIEDCEDEYGNKRKGVVFDSILMTGFLSEWQRRKKTLLTVKSARPNIQNGSLTGRKRPMTAVNMSPRKSGTTSKPPELQNNSVQLPVIKLLSLRF